MPFIIECTEAQEVTGGPLHVVDVTLERYRCDHSRALITLRLPVDKTVSTSLAGLWKKAVSLSGVNVKLQWKDDDVSPLRDQFYGYVECTDIDAHPGEQGFLRLRCASHSRLLELRKQFRVWQLCLLGDIIRYFGNHFSARIQIAKNISKWDSIPIHLRIQHNETDFAFLRRLMDEVTMPFRVDDLSGKIVLGEGSRLGGSENESSGLHWDIASPWKVIRYSQISSIFTPDKSDSVPTGYLPRMEPQSGGIRPSMPSSNAGTTSIGMVYLRWEGTCLEAHPGDRLVFASADYVIHSALLSFNQEMLGNTSESALKSCQEIWLEPADMADKGGTLFPMPTSLFADSSFSSQRHGPPTNTSMASREKMLARVIKNDGDPLRAGRLQVEFETEKVNNTIIARRCWLPILSPYSGDGADSNAGFFSLPEVGERVIVDFLTGREDDAYIIGSLRGRSYDAGAYTPRDEKLWRTPAGNMVRLFSEREGATLTERVQLSAGSNTFLDASIIGTEKTLVRLTTPSPTDQSQDVGILMEQIQGQSRVHIHSSGDIRITAGKTLELRGSNIIIQAEEAKVEVSGQSGVDIAGSAIHFIRL